MFEVNSGGVLRLKAEQKLFFMQNTNFRFSSWRPVLELTRKNYSVGVFIGPLP